MDWLNFRLHKRLSLEAHIIEQVYATISQIDGVKNSWRLTKRLLPQTIERLSQDVIITSTGASNRIEGNRLTDREVEDLYRNLRIKKFRTRDEQEIAGYLEVLELVFNNYGDMAVSESLVLQLHRDMMRHSDKDEGHRGGYKFGSTRVEAKDNQGNIVGIIFDPTPPHLVKKEMQELIAWYEWAVDESDKHPLILLANFVFEYLAIHPFQDGNGRTSRLLTNLMLLQHGYAFTSIASHEKLIENDKPNYYLALNKTQQSWKSDQEDISPWLLFFLGVVQQQGQSALELLDEDHAEAYLSEKQLAVLNWARAQSKPFARKDAIEALNMPPRTIEASIKKLVNLKKLNKIGEARATRYSFIDQ